MKVELVNSFRKAKMEMGRLGIETYDEYLEYLEFVEATKSKNNEPNEMD